MVVKPLHLVHFHQIHILKWGSTMHDVLENTAAHSAMAIEVHRNGGARSGWHVPPAFFQKLGKSSCSKKLNTMKYHTGGNVLVMAVYDGISEGRHYSKYDTSSIKKPVENNSSS
jgi:hypothetical protein